MSGKHEYRDPAFFVGHLAEVTEDSIYIGSSEADLDEELRLNMWSISITGEQAKTLTEDDFLAFIAEVLLDRRQQVKGADHGMIFYLWFDEMACQLRFNLISDFHLHLPFECRLEQVHTPVLIVREFLESAYHDGIPFREVQEIEQNDEVSALNPAQFVLPVYVEMIPNT